MVTAFLRTLKVVGLIVALVLSGLTLAKRSDPAEVQFVLLPDAIPSIDDPSFEPFGSAHDRVIGVEIGGEAKAYPISIMNFHEIANDELGGRPIAVTYCPLCATGVVYDRTMDGQTLEFRVSGRLYKSNLVMQDTATGSLWSQIEGRAIQGKYEGQELSIVQSTMTTLSAWRRQHPNTTVLSPPDQGRDYESDPYAGYDRSDDVLFPTDAVPGPLQPKDMVFGVRLHGERVAYPFRILASRSLVEDVVGGREIVVTHYAGGVQAFFTDGRNFTWDGGFKMSDEGGGTWNMVTGEGPGETRLEAVEALPSFWFAWVNAHPDTRIFAMQADPVPAAGLNLNLLHPITLAMIGILAYTGFMVGRYAWTRWRGRRQLLMSDWMSPKHGWVNGILAGIVGAAVLYDAGFTLLGFYRIPQTILGLALWAWGGALVWEWYVHRGREIRATNLRPEGIWWDCEDELDAAGYTASCREASRWHPAQVILELVENDDEVWVTAGGSVSIPEGAESLRETVDASLGRWANVEDDK